MAVRSKRLWGPVLVTTATVTLYTCPALETAILKTLTFVNNSALANTILIRLGGDLASQNLIAVALAGNGSSMLSDLFIVLQPGEILRAVATANGIVVTGSGAELEGVAD